MAMRSRFSLTAAAMALFSAAGVCVAACSSPGGADHHGGASAQDLICFGDSGLCIDADVPGFPEAGPFPSPPPWPDAGFPSFDAGIPGWDASFGVNYCPWQDPKYTTEYQASVWTGVKPCWLGCAATECCYANLGCVAQ
jgi:hypothetical protein